jgi:hypothetical protein
MASPLTLDATEMRSALTRLGEIAEDEGMYLELTVVGGACMLLGLGATASTRDVDYVASNASDEELRRLARIVAAERGWPEDWLNGNARTSFESRPRAPFSSKSLAFAFVPSRSSSSSRPSSSRCATT